MILLRYFLRIITLTCLFTRAADGDVKKVESRRDVLKVDVINTINSIHPLSFSQGQEDLDQLTVYCLKEKVR